MARRFEAEPILNLALLPVDGRQLRGQRWKGGKSLGNRSLQNHPAWIARPVEYIVVIENAFGIDSILGEDGHDSRLVHSEEVPDNRRDVGAVQQNHDLIGDRFFHGADQLREAIVKLFKECRHWPLTTLAASRINSRSGAGTQNPMTTSAAASASTEPSRQGRGGATGVSP